MELSTDPRTHFANSLIEANCVLIVLGAIDKRERDHSASESLHDGLRVYTDLLAYQRNIGLSPAQSKQLQGVLDRLRANLQSLRRGRLNRSKGLRSHP